MLSGVYAANNLTGGDMAPVIEPIDKSAWGPGPWQDEPDRKEWRHAGFVCLIVRVPSHGALCGYVGVPPGHPWHGKGYDEVETAFPDVSVHGGLTYADQCGGRVCHVPEPGEPDDLWWLGFDHAHAFDLSPAYAIRMSELYGPLSDSDEVYRDMAYATDGVQSLAECARSAAAAGSPAAVS